MSTPKLTLFHNDVDWVVAESPEDADRVYSEAIGFWPPDDSDWETWGEDRPLTITNDEDDEKVTLTGAEWAAKGRAYLGSTEY